MNHDARQKHYKNKNMPEQPKESKKEVKKKKERKKKEQKPRGTNRKANTRMENFNSMHPWLNLIYLKWTTPMKR